MSDTTRPSLSDGTNTVEFIRCSGQLQDFGQSSIDITRPGVDGVAFRQEGKRSMSGQFEALRDCTDDEVAEIKKNMMGFKGSMVTFTDDFGDAIDDVFVHDVMLKGEKRLGGAAGGINADTTSDSDTPPSLRLLTWQLVLQATKLPDDDGDDPDPPTD